MSGWNYRIVREIDDGGEPYYSFREVYYRDDGIPKSMTTEPSYPVGDTKEELIRDLAWFLKALTKPALGPDLQEVEAATFLADDLLKAIQEHPEHFADLISAPGPSP